LNLEGAHVLFRGQVSTAHFVAAHTPAIVGHRSTILCQSKQRRALPTAYTSLTPRYNLIWSLRAEAVGGCTRLENACLQVTTVVLKQW